LNLKGSVEFKTIPRSQVSSLKISSEFLSTSTNSQTLAHTILYSDAATLEVADIYHEFCRAKLNESGFTTIERASLNAMRDCSKDEPTYIRDANSAVVIVSEVYTNAMLLSKFPEESRTRVDGVVLRFESSDALTTLHTRMGFWGTAGICYYKSALVWENGQFPSKQIEDAINRASDGKEIRREYDTINSLLADLPNIDLIQTERISDTESIQIVDVIVRLFAAKTGLQC
jgi:hypothetical protein